MAGLTTHWPKEKQRSFSLSLFLFLPPSPHSLRIEQLSWRSSLCLSLSFSFLLLVSECPSLTTVINSRYHLQNNLIPRRIHIVHLKMGIQDVVRYLFSELHTTCAHLGNIVLEDPSLNADPWPSLHSWSLLHHPHDICHLSDGYHQLLPFSHPKVPNVLDGLFHVLLLKGLDVDVTFYTFNCHRTLDL